MWQLLVDKKDLHALQHLNPNMVMHPNKNGCIGMAIAFCGGLTVVTPLKEILNRMGF
jgi:hypothetical protein